MSLFRAVAVTVASSGMIAGCKTPTIPVSMNVAGEVKLNGVSKIALADFNSLSDDPFTGTMAADKETCALVRRAVAAAFYASPMYQIVDMDIEKNIHEKTGALPNKRFDAIVYGRLWWQMAPETSGQYPVVQCLTTQNKIPYMTKNVFTKKLVPAVAVVTVQNKDVVKMIDYRAQNATLMLTLSMYRLENSGDIVKIVDTYEVADLDFSLVNGEAKLCSIDRAVGGASESLLKTECSGAMPTELQTKLMLASSVTKSLGKKLAPSEKKVYVAIDLGDARLENLLKNGAFGSAKEYSMYTLRQKMGKQICDKIVSILPEFGQECAYPVPDSSAKKIKLLNKVAPAGSPISIDKMVECLESEDLDGYFYALGVCCEAMQDLDEALEYYRFAFNLNPSPASALGISRIYTAMGEAARIRQTRKAVKQADKKASLE